MKNVLPRLVIAATLLSMFTGAQAENELALYVFRDNNPAEGLTVAIDGREEKLVAPDGGVYFDLTPGAHSIQIRDNGNTLHTFRFDSAASQFVDISVLLLGLDRPRVRIEPHFKNETADVRNSAATGTILGRITTTDGKPAAGAEVRVRKTGTSTIADAGGNYSLVLPRGLYTFTLANGFGEQEVENIRVVANVQRGANFAVAPAAVSAIGLQIERPQVEEIFAVAKYNPVALGESERYSQGVVDTLGIGELARFGDSEVSASVIRIPSVTVVENRFVFIRGLGGRYITTTLNGSTLPSTDPVKRTVPLDLFPTNVVNQLDIKKTFVPSMPGESTGGNLVINTRTFPAEGGGQFSFSAGYTDGLTGDKVLADPIRNNYDWLGYDDGGRTDNSPLRAIANTLEFTDFFPDEVATELRKVGGVLLKDDWDATKRTANPLVRVGASYGDVYDVDWRDAEIGFFVAGNYKNDWQQREGVENTFDNQADFANEFDTAEYKNSVDVNGLVSFGMTAGNSSFTANTLYSHIGSSRTKVSSGFDGDELLPSARTTIEWVEREFISQQFTGNHIFGDREAWTANWQITASQANRDAPNRRDVRFDARNTDGSFNLIVPELVKRYDELRDDNFDASLDFDYNFDAGDSIASTLSFGAQIIHRERDSDSESYGFFGGQSIDDTAPNRLVADVITTGNITGNSTTGYVFANKTQPSDSYEAELDLNSGYLALDSLINDEYQVIVGARYEDYEQVTDTFETEGAQRPVQSSLAEGKLLPSLSFNWLFAEQQQLRFALTKTVSRPDFKETSKAVFYDPEFDIRVRGNPRLQPSEAINFDARYEYYWDDRDSISVAGFYKDLQNPIERVVVRASGTASNTRTFVNAKEAQIYGVEVDGRKEFGLNDALTQTFFVYGNVSWIDSEVKVGSETRNLQGQPEYTANLVLGFDDISRNQEITLLLNQSGKTIVDVGTSQLPDIIEEPRLDVGVRYKWYFSDNWQFRAKLQNLLDTATEFTQGGQTFRKYKTGRKIEIGFNRDF